MFVLTFITISLFVFVFVLKKIDRLYKIDKMLSNIPTLPSKPIIGHLHLIIGSSCEHIFERVVKVPFEKNETFKIWLGPYLTMIVQDKSDLKAIFQENEKPVFMKYSPEIMHEGILIAKGRII